MGMIIFFVVSKSNKKIRQMIAKCASCAKQEKDVDSYWEFIKFIRATAISFVQLLEQMWEIVESISPRETISRVIDDLADRV